MKKIPGRIILVDDEKYEKDLLILALHKKEWEVEVDYYISAEIAIEHLKKYDKEEIFLIISDMSMPGMSGLDFKKVIDNDGILCKKAIPFIFASTSASRAQVTEAFNYRVQGYFEKPETIDEQAEMLDTIIKYWILAKHPNKDDIHPTAENKETLIVGQ